MATAHEGMQRNAGFRCEMSLTFFVRTFYVCLLVWTYDHQEKAEFLLKQEKRTNAQVGKRKLPYLYRPVDRKKGGPEAEVLGLLEKGE